MSKVCADNSRAILAERLFWQAAERDDLACAQAIHAGQEVDGIYGLEEAGLLDEFWKFLEEVGAIHLFKQIQGEGIQRIMVPFFQYVVLYMLKVLFGVPSMHALPPLLFTNTAAMTLVGFNGYQINHGVCKRGKDKRKNKENKIGPICDDTLSRNILKISLSSLVRALNGAVRCLAVFGIFPKKIWISIDGSDLVTTPEYQGCGRAIRKKNIKDKNHRWQTLEIEVYGFKLMAAFYGALKIPVAAKVIEIQEHEGNYFFELLDSAQKNLAGGGVQILGVVIDRGYLDGKDLWAIKQRGLHFVIPAKSGMAVREDAKSIAAMSQSCRRWPATRKEKLMRGIGKKAHPVELETELVGVVGLTTYAQYGDENWCLQGNKKRGRYHPINAVVVKKWRGKDFGEKGRTVYLTDLPVRNPFLAFDHYDERSRIENCLFKEGKGGWHLDHFPAKTRQAVSVHVLFTLIVFALTNAYRHWRIQQDEIKQQAESELGIEQFRRLTKKESRNQAIIFIADRYGIFYLSEFAVLTGLRVKDLPQGYKNAEEILTHYSIPQKPP